MDEPEQLLNISVSEEDLREVWNKLARKKKEEGRDQLFMIMNQPFVFTEGVVQLSLTSPLQEDLINDFRTEIVQYLRENLRSNSIQISTQVVKPEAKKMIYTPQEKFNYLAEKQPFLLELKERLGLDPDF